MDWVPPNSEYPPPKLDEPPLHRAARLGDSETIRNLVASGHDVNAWFDIGLDPGGRDWNATPLMVAAGSSYGASEATMRVLLELGGDPNAKHHAGTIAFFAAAGLGWNYPPGGDAQRLRLALSLGCNPNEKDSRDVSLLAAAARTSDPDRVRLLLAQGANPSPPWNAEAATEGHFALADVFGADFLKLVSPPNAPYSFQIPLFNAVESDSYDSVEAILNAGANIHQRDREKRTCLYCACSPRVARLLTSRGADIEARDALDWTPLRNAVGESLAQVQSLLEAGADPNSTTDYGYTIFMSACGSVSRQIEILNSLVEAGANPFAVSELGYNALHAAIDVNGEANSEESVRAVLRYLFELGVDPKQKTQHGETPLDLARRAGTATEVAVLEELTGS